MVASPWRDAHAAVSPGAATVPSAGQAAALPSLAPLVKRVRAVVVNISTHTRSKLLHSKWPMRPDSSARPWNPFGQNDEGMPDSMQRFFQGPQGDWTQRTPEQRALGSGFLIGEGLVLTNNHVIDGADEIRVTTDTAAPGGVRDLSAKVVARDPKTDIALLRLQGDHLDQLPAASLGNSDALQVGDFVVAVGEPFGLEATVTSGIVSAKERQIGAGPYDDFIQTDASINPGNSGGPLFDLHGEVVGINTAIITGANNVGFAIPISLVEKLLPQLRTGKVVRGYLGVTVQPVTADMVKELGLDSPRGALVADVQKGTPAAGARLLPGDVIVAVDGRPMADSRQLTNSIAAIKPGTSVALDLVRDGKQKTIEVKLARLSDKSEAANDDGNSAGTTSDPLGLSTEDLTPDLSRQAHLRPSTHGAVVDEVAPGTPAAEAGIEQGDVVVEVDHKPISSADDYRKAVDGLKKGETALVRVRRGEGALYYAVKVES